MVWSSLVTSMNPFDGCSSCGQASSEVNTYSLGSIKPHSWEQTSTKCADSPWASCQIRKIAGCACAGNAGNVFPRGRLQRKLLVSNPDMHHGTCVTHVPWCMSGSLNRGGGENFPGIPGACATRNITYLARGPCATWHSVSSRSVFPTQRRAFVWR